MNKFDATCLHLLAAHEHGHLLLEVADDAGVHPQQPRALHQLVDLAHRRVAALRFFKGMGMCVRGEVGWVVG